MKDFIIDGEKIGFVDGNVIEVTENGTIDTTMILIRDDELKEAVKPVIDWLYKYGDPYVNVVINMAETNVYESFMHTLENELRD